MECDRDFDHRRAPPPTWGYNFGFGVVRSGEWMLQNSMLNGYSTRLRVVPFRRASIGAVAVTYKPEALKVDGTCGHAVARVGG